MSMKSIVKTLVAVLSLTASPLAKGEDEPQQRRRMEPPTVPVPTPPSPSQYVPLDEKSLEEMAKKLRSAKPSTDDEKGRKEANDKLIAFLGKVDSMELLRLDPKDPRDPPGEQKQKAESFHEYPILLQTTIGTADQRKELVTSLGKQLHWSEGWRASCFIPRHGLRAVIEKDTYDFVICLECHQMRVYKGDKLLGDTILLGEKWEVADKLLKEAEDKKEKRK